MEAAPVRCSTASPGIVAPESRCRVFEQMISRSPNEVSAELARLERDSRLRRLKGTSTTFTTLV
jgi:hypothetical protein